MHSHQSVSSRPAPAPVSKAIRQKLTFGDPVLDRLLRGGIPCGLITELAGELQKFHKPTRRSQCCQRSECIPLFVGGGMSMANMCQTGSHCGPVTMLDALLWRRRSCSRQVAGVPAAAAQCAAASGQGRLRRQRPVSGQSSVSIISLSPSRCTHDMSCRQVVPQKLCRPACELSASATCVQVHLHGGQCVADPAPAAGGCARVEQVSLCGSCCCLPHMLPPASES